MEEIVGEIRDEYDRYQRSVLRDDDGSVLVVGSLSVNDLKETLGIDNLPGEESRQFHT